MDPYNTDNNTENTEPYVLGPNDPEPVVIKPFHFVILNLATAGLYAVWWIYKSWVYFKQTRKEDIWPVMRTLFFPLFSIDFFIRIQTYCKEYDHKVSYNPLLLSILVIAFNIIAFLLGPLGIIATTLSFIPILPAVRELNFYFTGNKNGYVDDKLNDKQILLLVLGVIFWVLNALSLFIDIPKK